MQNKKSIQGKKVSKKRALKGLGDPETWKEFAEAAYNDFRRKKKGK